MQLTKGTQELSIRRPTAMRGIAVVVIATIALAVGAATVQLNRPSTASVAAAADPLEAANIIQFRADERAFTNRVTTNDPLEAPNVIQYRAGERSVSGTPADDPLEAPNIIQFRADERSGR